MNLKITQTATICILLVFISGCSGMSSLLELKSDMDSQEMQINIQKKNFQRAWLDIEKNKLTKDSSSDYIIKKYGEPIARITEKDKSRVRWAYTQNSLNLSGPRSYLYFDLKDQLVDWQNIE